MSKEGKTIRSHLNDIVDICGYNSSNLKVSFDDNSINEFNFEIVGKALLTFDVVLNDDQKCGVSNYKICLTMSSAGVSYNLSIYKNGDKLVYCIYRDHTRDENSMITFEEPWPEDFSNVTKKVKYFIDFPSSFYNEMKKETTNHKDNLVKVPLSTITNEIALVLIKSAIAVGVNLNDGDIHIENKRNKCILSFPKKNDSVVFQFDGVKYSAYGSVAGTINGLNFFIEYGRDAKKGFKPSYVITLDKIIGDERIDFSIRNNLMDGQTTFSTTKYPINNGDGSHIVFSSNIDRISDVLPIVTTIASKPYISYVEFEERDRLRAMNYKNVKSIDACDFDLFATILGIDIEKVKVDKGLANDGNDNTTISGKNENLSFEFVMQGNRLSKLLLIKKLDTDLKYWFEIRITDGKFNVIAIKQANDISEVSVVCAGDSLFALVTIIEKINNIDLDSMDNEVFMKPSDSREKCFKKLLGF